MRPAFHHLEREGLLGEDVVLFLEEQLGCFIKIIANRHPGPEKMSIQLYFARALGKAGPVSGI